MRIYNLLCCSTVSSLANSDERIRTRTKGRIASVAVVAVASLVRPFVGLGRGSGMGGEAVDPGEMVRAVVEAAVEAVVVLAPDGRVLLTNPAHDALFGRPVRMWWGDYRDLWTPSAQAALDRELAGGPALDGVAEATGASGRCFPVWRRPGVVQDAAGKVLYRFAFLHDHSDQQRADAAKSRFLAAASHDLRQPLQALSMFVSVLSSREHSPANRKVIDRIEEALAATDSQITSLVEISKLEAGVVMPVFGPVALARLLTYLGEDLRPTDGAVELRVVPSSAVVHSDATLLERLLRHLVSNALRFTVQGRILIGCRRRGDALRIEVWDSGPGIAPDQIDAIFREFHTLDQGRRQGLGLGLAIVDRLARRLGHTVTVRSWPGRGSVFAVEMPLARDGGGGD